MNQIFSLNILKFALIKALAHVQTIVERRNMISVLSNVKIFSNSEGVLELTATDMSIAVTEKIHTQVVQGWSFTVSAHMLFDIVRKLDDNHEITLEITSDNPMLLKITSGKSNFFLSTLPASDFPVIDSDDFNCKFSIDSSKLRELIDKTKFAICNENTRYNLNGMHLHFDKCLHAVTTDGHRLCIVSVNIEEDLSSLPSVIVSKKMVNEMRKIIDEFKGEIHLSISPRKIQVESNDIKLISKLIDAKFPDYTGLIPQDNKFRVEADTKLFAKAIDRVSTITDEKSRGIKLCIENNTIIFSASSEFGGSSEELIQVESNITDKLTIGFNARYLLEGMMAIKGEKVILSIKDSFSSILVEDSSDKSFKYILMPMRV